MARCPQSGQPRRGDRRLPGRSQFRPGRRQLRRGRDDDRHQRRADAPRRAVVYLTTEGFQDVPHIQRINRKHHYDFHWRKPTPLVHRPDCLGVPERMDEEGRVLDPIDLEALATALEEVVARGEELPAVAVCFLFSYLNPEHELAARELLAQRFPQLAVSLSHEVAPIWREYERGTTVTVDAYLKPLFERYVDGRRRRSRARAQAAPGRCSSRTVATRSRVRRAHAPRTCCSRASRAGRSAAPTLRARQTRPRRSRWTWAARVATSV